MVAAADLDADELRQRIANGQTVASITREMFGDVQRRHVVKRALELAGIDLPDSDHRWRRPAPEIRDLLATRIDDMRSIDAVVFLLDVIEVMVGADVPLGDDPAILKLTGKQRQLYQLLQSRAPLVVSRDAVMAHLYADRAEDEVPDLKIIDVMVMRLRRWLAEHRTHEMIETIREVGFRLAPR